MINKFSAEWLAARSAVIAVLLKEGVLESRNDIVGFWKNDEWVSVYDLMEKEND